jgi:hypothetical protein
MNDITHRTADPTWQKLPAVEGSVACLTCGCGARGDLHMDRHIAVGFGSAGYSKDGAIQWDESMIGDEYEGAPMVCEVEAIAAADPDHDWRIYFMAPLYEAEYQRQGPYLWVLIRKGEGFA